MYIHIKRVYVCTSKKYPCIYYREKVSGSYPSIYTSLLSLSLSLSLSPASYFHFLEAKNSSMRIRKNSLRAHPESSSGLKTPLQAHFCQLNQSPWDLSPSSPSSPSLQVTSFLHSLHLYHFFISHIHRSDKPHYVIILSISSLPLHFTSLFFRVLLISLFPCVYKTLNLALYVCFV